MRSGRKESEWRVFGIAAFLTIAAFVAMLTGCLTVRHDPSYDGGPVIYSVAGDSVTYIRITIQNVRVHDPVDPHFYLVGSGRHSLGIIGGPGGKSVQFIDTKWLGPDGCAVVVAHYSGWGEIILPKFCWQSGYVIDVQLNEIASTSSSWAHR